MMNFSKRKRYECIVFFCGIFGVVYMMSYALTSFTSTRVRLRVRASVAKRTSLDDETSSESSCTFVNARVRHANEFLA